ncbi:TRAP transporter substrate-binding protein DctP [Poseidonocella sp. HB161398]|uniref:TRAP transporter substrate-binding protein DctP n=1 Tax=Poseidonocella sp. HB161398 TaxID=2320855 RepID=UPI0011092F3D|nr:TRAP transporter substrate-binding protein DctP [Poseidonocella sp. HB161398]
MTRDTTLAPAGLALMAAAAMGTALAAGLPSAAQAAEVEGPKVRWLVSLWGARRGFTEGVEGLKDYLAEKTDGRFELSLEYGGVLSDPKENIDGLQLGAFEAATICPYYHPEKTPASMGMSLAFLPLPDFAAQIRAYDAFLAHPAVQGEWAKWNAVPLMSALMPNYEVMGRGEAPVAAADWDGLRVNASAGHAVLMEALGAVPSTMPAPDLYTSLERGVIDGIVYPYTYAFVAYRFHELSDWVTDSWNLGTIQCTVAAGKDAWEALPGQYKALMAEAIPEAYARQIAAYAEIDAANEALFEEQDLARIPITPEIRAGLDAAAQPSWQAWIDDMTGRGYPGQELFDILVAGAADAQPGQ